ncbi:hypothetical protein NHQ30_006230 [Ciborinia camelliae]|nr:hypothetical protein NHQ30_006230 [Ciborinia camelliae]
MESYQNVWPEFINRIKRDDCKHTLDKVKDVLARCTIEVKYDPKFAKLTKDQKEYRIEKSAWVQLFGNHSFPGIRPQLIEDVELTNSQPTTSQGSKSISDKIARTSKSSPRGKEKENTSNIKPPHILPSVKTPKTSPGSSTTAALISNHPPITYSSSAWRPVPMLMQPNGIPMFSTGPIEYQNAEAWLVGYGDSARQVDERFPGVRIRTGTFESGLFFYAEPFYLSDKKNKIVLEQCRKCNSFLECYSAKAKTSSVRLLAITYFHSSEWGLIRDRGRKSESHNQLEPTDSKEAASQIPPESERSTNIAISLEEKLKATTTSTESISTTKTQKLKAKREITNFELDDVSLSRTKRVKMQQSRQSDTIKELWNRPRYSILVLLTPDNAEWLLKRKVAVEEHFRVGIGYGFHKEELIFYCKPLDNNISLDEAIELCEPAFRFLREFLRHSYRQPCCIEAYLKSSSWVTRGAR